jgi:hypothetical protein
VSTQGFPRSLYRQRVRVLLFVQVKKVCEKYGVLYIQENAVSPLSLYIGIHARRAQSLLSLWL